MLTAQTEELLGRLRSGIFDSADVQALEQPLAHDLVAELDSRFPYRFQERRLRDKWEISMARSLHFELACRISKGASLPLLHMAPVYRHCVFLSGEGDAVTGIGVVTRLRVRPIRKPFHGLSLLTGRGFKLDRTIDGWQLNPHVKRTIKLTEDLLQKRGWNFDVMRPLSPQP